ncbi:alpha/beta fold hydrolase [Spirosoma agri]|uniref:Alpha/beta hydrolase n=1 Tax=Spirosoma agri TaxID=1987381 RepID=A0A6M0IEY5_9BACT|nr:alpha/beta hydrolase [Spirosoma agri]NEU66352.1 alpha/beta hydrolase [Spirosoma agri]
MQTPLSILLIHGHGVDASIWDGIYADLAAEGTVLNPDLSRLTSHTTIEAYAEELAARLQAVSISEVVLIGHSMGGYIALAFAGRYPEMVRGLVLYHSTAYADDEDRKAQRQQLIKTMQTEGGVQFIEKQLPKMVAPDYPADQVNKLVGRFRNLPTEALVAGMEAIAGRPDRTYVLRNATFPVLLVMGREDQLIPLEKTKPLADLSGQISIATIDNAGHMSMVEQPDESKKILVDFLRKL